MHHPQTAPTVLDMRHDATQSDTLSDTVRSYSTAEAAHLLGVHRQTVHRWVVANELPAFNVGTTARPRLRITEQAIRDFITARQFA